MSIYCDRCLDPFNEADCHPDPTPAGEDWSELCPSCRAWRLKYRIEEDITTEEAA